MVKTDKNEKASEKPGKVEDKAADQEANRYAEEEARRIAEGAAEGRAQEEARLRAEEEAGKMLGPPGAPRYVEVIVENLGPKLLKKGSVTDDPEIVALLDTPRGRRLVRDVTPEGQA